MTLPEALMPIHAVERETGVSKELLRMWERRYSFPRPLRDQHGDRVYPADQVLKLRIIRRLIEFGLRPGKLIDLPIDALEDLLRTHNRRVNGSSMELEDHLLGLLRSHDPQALRDFLDQQLAENGLEKFIIDCLQFTNFMVGEAWARGRVEIFEEHLYTVHVQQLLRKAIQGLPPATGLPRVLLTTPPEEHHTLGLMMVEALLRIDKVDAQYFGPELPVKEIIQAITKHKLDAVVLSFSASYATARAITFLEELRCKLPMSIEIWAGGGALGATRRHAEGVVILHSLEEVRRVGYQWKIRRGVRG